MLALGAYERSETRKAFARRNVSAVPVYMRWAINPLDAPPTRSEISSYIETNERMRIARLGHEEAGGFATRAKVTEEWEDHRRLTHGLCGLLELGFSDEDAVDMISDDDITYLPPGAHSQGSLAQQPPPSVAPLPPPNIPDFGTHSPSFADDSTPSADIPLPDSHLSYTPPSSPSSIKASLGGEGSIRIELEYPETSLSQTILPADKQIEDGTGPCGPTASEASPNTGLPLLDTFTLPNSPPPLLHPELGECHKESHSLTQLNECLAGPPHESHTFPTESISSCASTASTEQILASKCADFQAVPSTHDGSEEVANSQCGLDPTPASSSPDSAILLVHKTFTPQNSPPLLFHSELVESREYPQPLDLKRILNECTEEMSYEVGSIRNVDETVEKKGSLEMDPALREKVERARTLGLLTNEQRSDDEESDHPSKAVEAESITLVEKATAKSQGLNPKAREEFSAIDAPACDSASTAGRSAPAKHLRRSTRIQEQVSASGRLLIKQSGSPSDSSHSRRQNGRLSRSKAPVTVDKSVPAEKPPPALRSGNVSQRKAAQAIVRIQKISAESTETQENSGVRRSRQVVEKEQAAETTQSTTSNREKSRPRKRIRADEDEQLKHPVGTPSNDQPMDQVRMKRRKVNKVKTIASDSSNNLGRTSDIELTGPEAAVTEDTFATGKRVSREVDEERNAVPAKDVHPAVPEESGVDEATAHAVESKAPKPKTTKADNRRTRKPKLQAMPTDEDMPVASEVAAADGASVQKPPSMHTVSLEVQERARRYPLRQRRTRPNPDP